MVKANLKKLYNKKYHFLSFVKIVKESMSTMSTQHASAVGMI